MTLENPGTALASEGLETLAGGESISALALLGKTAFALAIVIAVIFLFAWLARRFNLHQGSAAAQHLKVVGNVAVGQRERVVLVEVDKTWLVLGVGGGQVTHLHELPAPDVTPGDEDSTTPADGFAHRLARSLAKQVSTRRNASPGETSS